MTDPFSELLYPMLSEQPSASASVLAALTTAPLQKAAESDRLRCELVEASGDDMVLCARRLAERFDAGGRLFACGNGGSAASAADLVTELLDPTPPHQPLPALCLTSDVAVITAVANDVSFDDVFARQLIAHGRAEDIVVLISTSGNSENLVRAARIADQRRLLTVGLSGYDGGRMSREARLDHCFTVRSSSVHRIQEVQTTVYHLLIEMVHRFRETAVCA